MGSLGLNSFFTTAFFNGAFFTAAAILLSGTCFAEEQEIRIGLLAGLSGYTAMQGADCKRGYELARKAHAPNDMVNGYRLKFIYGDTQGIPKVGVTEFKRLAEVEKIHAAVVIRSPVGMAINPISKQNGISLLGVIGHADFVPSNQYAFGLWPSAAVEGAVLAEKVAQRGKRRIAILSSEDDWTISFRDAFVGAYTRKGGTIVFNEAVLKEETDFRSHIVKIKLKNADAILVNLVPGQPGTAVRQIRELGLKQQIFGSFFIRMQQEIDIAGHAAIEGTLLVELDFERPIFLKTVEDLFGGVDVTGVTYTCYAGVAAIVQALAHNQGVRDRASLYDALRKLDRVPILDGTLKMHDREAQHELRFKVVHDGVVAPLQS